MIDEQSSAHVPNAVHRPSRVIVWLLIFVVVIFFGFGAFWFIPDLGVSAAVAWVLAAFFFVWGFFCLFITIGFRSQHITLREEGISFRLAPLGINLVMPWKLQSESLPWNAVRAVDVKLRNLGGPQKVFVLRTTVGDVTFFWPQWPNADAIAQEIIRRSGATTSTEDMDLMPVTDPSHPEAPSRTSTGERSCADSAP